MQYSKQILDEIKNKIRLSDIIGRDIKLHKRGNEFVGLSPFNKEKTPSFFVNDQKQFYHCFSSGKGGDVFKFLMETKGTDFQDTIKQLAEIAGITLPQRIIKNSIDNDRQNHIYKAMTLTKEFFKQQLVSQTDNTIHQYLQQRGLNEETIQNFQLGYAPNSYEVLKTYLARNGIQETVMQEAGLIITDDHKAKNFDRFRNRLIFPILDIKGQCIAFGGRALSKTAKAKYLNSPETPVFKKRYTLYNLSGAKEAIFKKKRLIVVEGYMDVVSLTQAGFKEVIAPLGTAISLEQIKLMWRYDNNPIFCFDGDKAGQQAALRLTEKVFPELKPGYSLQFVSLEKSMDPDDYIQHFGNESFEKKLHSAESLDNFVWRNIVVKYPLNTPENKAKCEIETETFINTINDPLVRQHYKKDFKDRFFQLWRPLKKSNYKMNTQSMRVNSINQTNNPIQESEAKLLSYLISYPYLLEENFEKLMQLNLKTPQYKKLLHNVIDVLAKIAPQKLNHQRIVEHLIAKGQEKIVKELEKLLTDSSIYQKFTQDCNEMKYVKEGYALAYNYHKKLILKEQLNQEKISFATSFNEQNLQEIQSLKKQILELEKE